MEESELGLDIRECGSLPLDHILISIALKNLSFIRLLLLMALQTAKNLSELINRLVATLEQA